MARPADFWRPTRPGSRRHAGLDGRQLDATLSFFQALAGMPAAQIYQMQAFQICGDDPARGDPRRRGDNRRRGRSDDRRASWQTCHSFARMEPFSAYEWTSEMGTSAPFPGLSWASCSASGRRERPGAWADYGATREAPRSPDAPLVAVECSEARRAHQLRQKLGNCGIGMLECAVMRNRSPSPARCCGGWNCASVLRVWRFDCGVLHLLGAGIQASDKGRKASIRAVLRRQVHGKPPGSTLGQQNDPARMQYPQFARWAARSAALGSSALGVIWSWRRPGTFPPRHAGRYSAIWRRRTSPAYALILDAQPGILSVLTSPSSAPLSADETGKILHHLLPGFSSMKKSTPRRRALVSTSLPGRRLALL